MVGNVCSSHLVRGLALEPATRTRARSPVSQFETERRTRIALSHHVGAVFVVQA